MCKKDECFNFSCSNLSSHLRSFKMCNIKILIIFFSLLISTKSNKDNFQNIFDKFLEKVESKAIETYNIKTKDLSTLNNSVSHFTIINHL